MKDYVVIWYKSGDDGWSVTTGLRVGQSNSFLSLEEAKERIETYKVFYPLAVYIILKNLDS